MRIPGKRIKKTRYVRTEHLVVAVEVEAVIPDFDTSEPVYEPEVVELIRDVEIHAKAGDIAWLQQHGKVYQAIGAA